MFIEQLISYIPGSVGDSLTVTGVCSGRYTSILRFGITNCSRQEFVSVRVNVMADVDPWGIRMTPGEYPPSTVTDHDDFVSDGLSFVPKKNRWIPIIAPIPDAVMRILSIIIVSP